MKDSAIVIKIIFLIGGIFLFLVECSEDLNEEDIPSIYERELEVHYEYHQAFMDSVVSFLPTILASSYFEILADSTQLKIRNLDSAYQETVIALITLNTKRQNSGSLSSSSYANYSTNLFKLKELKALPNIVGLKRYKLFTKDKSKFEAMEKIDFHALQQDIEKELSQSQKDIYTQKIENLSAVFPYHPSSMSQMILFGNEKVLDIPKKKSQFPTRIVECLMLESRARN